MRAIQCSNGVNVKLTIGKFEVSIAFENPCYSGTTPQVGQVYSRSNVRIYKNDRDVTSSVYEVDAPEGEAGLLALMTQLAALQESVSVFTQEERDEMTKLVDARIQKSLEECRVSLERRRAGIRNWSELL